MMEADSMTLLFLNLLCPASPTSCLPANTPHNPCRFENTVGIVIERVRPSTAVGKLVLLRPADLLLTHAGRQIVCGGTVPAISMLHPLYSEKWPFTVKI